MRRIDWTTQWPKARKILAQAAPGTNVVQLLPELKTTLGPSITRKKIHDACSVHEGMAASKIIGSEWSGPEPTEHQRGFESLVKLCRSGIDFHILCDKLDMSPSKTRGHIEAAQSAGYHIDIAGSTVAQRPSEPSDEVQDCGLAPVVNGRHLIGIIGDIHAGSKYCLRDQMQDFVRHAYESGVRHMFVPGDLIDGCYKHGQWELSHHGVDDQTDDLIETLPRFDGLEYHFITGNHDETFTQQSGLDTGRLIEERAQVQCRTDLHYHGCRGGLLRLGTVKIELWHPKSGKAYALSYKLQNHIRDMPAATGRKPDILIAGHWHTFCYFEQRGIHAIASPCWQGGGSSFGKSLGGAPSIGGLIVSWELTNHGTLRRVAVERSAYYEVEHYRDVG